MLYRAIAFWLLLFYVADLEAFHPYLKGGRGPVDRLKLKGDVKYHETKFFTQKLDHFDASNTNTWPQRYFISNQTYIPGAPVFLHLGGEWEADPLEIELTYLGELAEKLGALTIDLEHRYFGQSRPVADTSLPNLRYQSLDQAIEDAAFFTTSLKAELGLNGPWVVIGASYPANLAAWARAKYPNVFDFAYASSAPSLAIHDNYLYLEVINEAMTSVHPGCPSVVQSAINELEALIADGNAAKITELFNLHQEINLANRYDTMYLTWHISWVIGEVVQYAHWGSMERMCQTLLDGLNEPLDTVAKMVTDYHGNQTINVVTEEIHDFHANDIVFSDRIARPLMYLNCNEMAYFLTTTSTNQPFGQNLPLEFHTIFCENVLTPMFNYAHTSAAVNVTNEKFGGLTPDVTRVLYTHGTLDPWHALGIEQDLNADTPVIMIEGESHCRDIYAIVSDEQDSDAIKAARLQVEAILANWLLP